MMNLLGYGDIERWIICALIGLSLYFLWSNKHANYDKRTKSLLTIPRAYILLYNLIVITDLYNITQSSSDLIRTGIGGVYGSLMLFGVEAYVRWVNKKYGRC